MKKRFLALASFVLLSTVLMFFYSCSDDSTKDSLDQNNKEVNIESLLANLKEYDRVNFDGSRIEENGSLSKPCSGFWDCGRRFLEVSAADVAGGVAGAGAVQIAAGIAGAATAGTGYVVVSVGAAAVVGAGASSAMLRTYEVKSAPAVQFGNPNNTVKIGDSFGGLNVKLSDAKFSAINNTGKLHNYVMNNYERTSTAANQALYDKLELKDDGLKIIKYIEEKEIVNQVKDITIKNYNKDNKYDHRQLLKSFEAEKLISVNSREVLSVFLDSFKSVKAPAELEKLVNYYISEIENSKLKDDDKIMILAGLMIASESPFYAFEYLNITEND